VKIVGLLARHQVGAIIATLVDFLTMILWVELGIGSPVSGTAMGAAAGGLSNFVVGRNWVFRDKEGEVRGQALRYALVSSTCLGWNTLGQKFLLGVTTLPYPVTRMMISFAVGVVWNFPLHRWFVFPRASAGAAPATAPTETA
jgi:putative flippase GtrA